MLDRLDEQLNESPPELIRKFHLQLPVIVLTITESFVEVHLLVVPLNHPVIKFPWHTVAPQLEEVPQGLN